VCYSPWLMTGTVLRANQHRTMPLPIRDDVHPPHLQGSIVKDLSLKKYEEMGVSVRWRPVALW
jgi:hypothetical protein